MEQEKLITLLGQRLAVGFEGYEIPEDFIRLVRTCRVGNVILFRRNVRDRQQLAELCAALRRLILEETGLQPLIMLDEECGSVSRLAHIAAPTPSAMAIGATGDTGNARAIGRLIGTELRSMGINMNLAPVLDVMINPENRVIGTRAFGTDPETVSRMGCAYLEGLQSTGILACGKHFPGHGDTSVDSHIGLPLIEKSGEEIRRVELAPFRAAIAAGVQAIMSAHVIFPAFEPDRVPATVSRRVMTDLLRDELGFDGLIVSDGMEMQAVMDLYGIEDGVMRAMNAGVDICLVCHSPRQAQDTMAYCLQAIRDGRMPTEQLEAHDRRIRQAKAGLPPMDASLPFGSEAQKQLARDIMDAALLHGDTMPDQPPLHGDTLCFGAPARQSSLANDPLVLNAAARIAEACGGTFVQDPFGQLPEIGPDTVLVSILTHNDPLLEERVRLTNRLADAGRRVIAVAMTTPFLLDGVSDRCRKLAVYQYDAFGLAALIRRLMPGEARS